MMHTRFASLHMLPSMASGAIFQGGGPSPARGSPPPGPPLVLPPSALSSSMPGLIQSKMLKGLLLWHFQSENPQNNS